MQKTSFLTIILLMFFFFLGLSSKKLLKEKIIKQSKEIFDQKKKFTIKYITDIPEERFEAEEQIPELNFEPQEKFTLTSKNNRRSLPTCGDYNLEQCGTVNLCVWVKTFKTCKLRL